MNTIECIKSRRSVRTFEDRSVDEAVIRDIISVATYAPSWKNSQTTRYIAIYNKELKDAIASGGVMGSSHNKGIIDGAPVLVVVLTKNLRSGYERDGSFSTSKGRHFESFDAGIATEAFCLAAHEMGVSTVIMGILDEASIKEILSIGEDMSVSALVAMGYNDIQPDAPKRKGVNELLTILK